MGKSNVVKLPVKRRKQQQAKEYVRPIRCDFYDGKKIVAKTHGLWAMNAVPNAVRHMQIGQYDATHVEIHDMSNGVLHAVLRCQVVDGLRRIQVLFKREVKDKT